MKRNNKEISPVKWNMFYDIAKNMTEFPLEQEDEQEWGKLFDCWINGYNKGYTVGNMDGYENIYANE